MKSLVTVALDIVCSSPLRGDRGRVFLVVSPASQAVGAAAAIRVVE